TSFQYKANGTTSSTAGTATPVTGLIVGNPIQLNTGPGALTVSGANNMSFAGVISGAGSITENMATSPATVFYFHLAANTNTFTGVTNIINGVLNVNQNSSDGAWASGGVAAIGNGQTGTQATLLDNSNDVPNNATIIVNNSGAFLQTTAGDALGGFILNGG